MAGTSLIAHLNDENFSKETTSGLILVDFYADWCGPCRMMTPVIEKLAGEYKGKLKVAKLDIETAQKTTGDFGVTSIPTCILFKEGEPVLRIVGLKNEESLKKLLAEYIQ